MVCFVYKYKCLVIFVSNEKHHPVIIINIEQVLDYKFSVILMI